MVGALIDVDVLAPSIAGLQGALSSSTKGIQFRTIADASRLISRSIHIFQDFDIMVGVPRSGMLISTMIATGLNAPMVSLDSFLRGEVGQDFTRRPGPKHSRLQGAGDRLRVLVCDDSVSSGTAHGLARKAIEDRIDAERFDIKYLAVFSCSYSPKLDYQIEEVDHPRVFEWNYMHHEYTGDYCVDLDGLIAADPLPIENDDGEHYLNFVRNARLRLHPTRGVGIVVTSRLEKYRALTLEWLEKNGIRHKGLVMLNLPTAEERRRLNLHGKFKAAVYARLGGRLFVESERWQAEEIARTTGRAVFSVEGSTFFPGK